MKLAITEIHLGFTALGFQRGLWFQVITSRGISAAVLVFGELVFGECWYLVNCVDGLVK